MDQGNSNDDFDTWDDYYRIAVDHFKKHGQLKVLPDSVLGPWLASQFARTDFNVDEINKLREIRFFDAQEAFQFEEIIKQKMIGENWTESDDEFLLDHQDFTILKLAQVLNKPTSMVRSRRRQLGILRTIRRS
ncbi:hypothetical protein [Aquirhabdus parva]|uniref:Uncharacterized protein n=1 Tax=Aquirhabdus parva TaxID=2283318 RepID=A0A345P7X4_9GAMM|nr:hypothetical protein [Aquirhabdus parva]AXI03383.1 hypothetical protein HYN46_11350 [Aquirhabdus parva]